MIVLQEGGGKWTVKVVQQRKTRGRFNNATCYDLSTGASSKPPLKGGFFGAHLTLIDVEVVFLESARANPKCSLCAMHCTCCLYLPRGVHSNSIL
ncbi:hypothetical protein CDAR_609491 [Caerostris darwini]|uniref:Uncharacterized protein n=1 Tax=Caerostris darwini TaxID=1538125 RepID=A0AAV4VX10_9ARAC|nr:hypothetical protein CDAR_609491 [Caerostris darwini]